MAAKIRRDDTVEVNTGKDRGKRAQVRQVLPQASRVVLHGLNLVKKHRRQRTATEASAIVEIEAPLPPHYSRQDELPLHMEFEISQIGTIVDNTIKTRFIFEINKGCNKIGRAHV